MKRMLTVILGLILASGIAFAAPTNTAPSQGVTFAEGINSKKPMIVLLYAPWSKSTKQVTANMAALKKAYGAKANFVLLNIAANDAKYYNDLFPIQPNLPNIMMFKDKAKISKAVSKDCAIDYACVSKRVSQFIH